MDNLLSPDRTEEPCRSRNYRDPDKVRRTATVTHSDISLSLQINVSSVSCDTFPVLWQVLRTSTLLD